MSDHHRLLIRQSLRHMRYIEEMIEELDKEIAMRLKPYQQQLKLACTVPGIQPNSAASILAETGMDMSPEGRFPTAITRHRGRRSVQATMRAPVNGEADEHDRATGGCEQP